MITRVVESASRGKVTVATREYLPGELVLEEEPIVVVPKEYVDLYKDQFTHGDHELHVPFANYLWFTKRISADVRNKVLSFSGRMSEKEVDRFRQLVRHLFLCNPNNPRDRHRITPTELDLIVKIAGIMTLNKFVAEDQILYTEASKFSHSCDANCLFIIEPHQKTIAIQACKHIHVGEEMTISCVEDRDTEPTHVRRKKYLEERGFTCHCPRCDAPGDDTRQFDCCWCKEGVMMVCQPLSQEDFWTDIPFRIVSQPPDDEEWPMSGPRYDGVEYVEPHLLPCTVCHHAAPLEYQDAMFKLEEELPQLGQYFTATSAKTVGGLELITKFEKLRLPRRHALCIPIFRAMIAVRAFQFVQHMSEYEDDTPQEIADREQCRNDVYRAVHLLLSAQEAITPGARLSTLDAMGLVCHQCVFHVHRMRAAAPAHMKIGAIHRPQDAKTLIQKVLRMGLVLCGRDGGHNQLHSAELNQYLLQALQELPPAVPSMEVCAFCEESPASAFMKRSRCGACKKVMYCSAGCQKAHWKLHKKTCTKEKNR